MTRLNQILRVALLLAVLAGGTFLLSRPGVLRPEGLRRQIAIRQAVNNRGSAQTDTQADPDVGLTVTHEPVAPTVVNLANVVQTTEDPNSFYNRWLRGEIDGENEASIVSPEELARLKALSLSMGPSDNVQSPEEGPATGAPIPGTSFASIDYSQSGGAVPPDPELAAGPNHLIAVVNTSVAIYSKSGTALFGPTTAASIFQQPACKSGLYDPNVLYDEEDNRWIIAYDKDPFGVGGGYCMLVSVTGNPLGSYYEYFFPLNNSTSWMDFPHAGVGDNYVFMGGNIFNMSGSFVEGRLYAFDKSRLYAGQSTATIQRGLGSNYDTPQPLHLHGASTNTWPNFGNEHYFLAEPFDGRNYTLFRWNPASGSLSNRGNIDLLIGSSPPIFPVDAQQLGTGAVQANDWRPLDFEYRNGYGWTTMTVGCNPGAGTVDCVRWAQIDLGSASLGPSGKGWIGSNGVYRFFPDLAVNHCNDMVVGYTKSSASTYYSVWLAGRDSLDPVGSLQAEMQLKAGETTYTSFPADTDPHRWGDYTGMTIDPNGLTYWYLGEYSKNIPSSAKWGTYIGSFTMPGCSTPPPPNLQPYAYLPLINR